MRAFASSDYHFINKYPGVAAGSGVPGGNRADIECTNADVAAADGSQELGQKLLDLRRFIGQGNVGFDLGQLRKVHTVVR